MRQIVKLAFLFLWLPVVAFAQCVTKPTPEYEVFERYVAYIEPFIGESKECLLDKTATFFLDTPYVGGTLDVNEQEELVVNFEGLDCVTFIETVMALANTAEGNALTFDAFTNELQRIRYRDGVLTDYASRLHYTTDWIDNNVAKGVLEPMEWEGELSIDRKRIDFMSSHRTAYNALKEDDALLEKIEVMEDRLNEREGFVYLPKDEIEANKHRIPHMAMIAFTTSIKGLDTTHTGFAYHKEDVLTFIHASSLKNKVVIDDKRLEDYCRSQKRCTGIVVMHVK